MVCRKLSKRKFLEFQFNKKSNLMNISIYICQEVMNKMTQMQHNKTKQNKNENNTETKTKKRKKSKENTKIKSVQQNFFLIQISPLSHH